MMDFHSKLKPFDIFFAEKKNEFGEAVKHYWVCIYTQADDPNNRLTSDVYGLMITTNQKYKFIRQNDYNVQIVLNGKTCFVCCDKIQRMRIDDKFIPKGDHLSLEKKAEIKTMFDKFMFEIQRQVGGLK